MSNQPKLNKVIKVMTTAALTAGVVAPMVAPAVASANSDNLVNKVLHVDNDFVSTTEVKDNDGNVIKTPATDVLAGNYLLIKESDIDFAADDTFRLSLPAGAKWLTDVYKGNDINATGTIVETGSGDYFEVVSVTDQDLELKIKGFDGKFSDQSPIKESVAVPMYFEVDGAEGEVKVSVDAKGSTLTSGQYTIAVVAEGKTSATVSEVKTIGDGDAIGTIRIDELALGTLENGRIVLTLPNKFKWAGTEVVTLGSTELDASYTDNKLTINVAGITSAEKLKTIYISGLAINADKDAAFGDIEVEVSGDGVTDQDIVVAKYADYATEVSVEDEVPTVLAGRNNVDTDDLETAEITIKEEVAGSWISNRDVQIEFPSWVKVVGYEVSGVKGFAAGAETDIQDDLALEVKGDSNEIELSSLPQADNGKTREFKVKFFVSTKADATGDITAAFSGRAGIEGEVVVAKAVAPVNVDFEKANVRTGIKNQAINDITVTEAAKGALVKGKKLEFQLSDGVDFSDKPTVEIVEGNLEIDKSTIEVDNGKLSFEIKSESTRASKIKISNVKVDLDRAVPQGDIDVEVGGEAIVQNADVTTGTAFDGNNLKIGEKTFGSYDLTNSSIEVGEFDRDYAVKKAIATVVTPADGNATVGEVIFTVGQKTFAENGVEQTMDVAPFIEGSRTYLPVRYVAQSVGVEGSNILWDEASRKVTIIKDDRIAQLTIGSNILTVNGAQIAMDTKAKVVDGRTVLPLRAVAQALGAKVDWNEADRTVTVK